MFRKTTKPQSHFYNLDAAREEITGEQIESAKMGNKNYSVSNAEYALGAAEHIGRRGSQEDSIDDRALPGLSLLNEATQNAVFQQTIDEISREIKGFGSGSCLLTCIICPLPKDAGYEVIAINLGDSEGLIAKYNRENNTGTLERMTHIHHPLEESEERRNKMVHYGNRINGMLAVSRALGDDDFVAAGLSHEAEITRRKITGDELKEEMHLFVVCDGIRENARMTDDKFIAAVKEHHDNPALLAENIITQAFASGSRDNLSVQTTRLTKRDQPIDAPIAISVYDGHGGCSVSQYAREHFLNRLAQNIRARVQENLVALNDKLPQSMSEKIRLYLSSVNTALDSKDAKEFIQPIQAARELYKRIRPELNNLAAPNQSVLDFFANKKLETTGLKDNMDLLAELLDSAEANFKKANTILTEDREVIRTICDSLLKATSKNELTNARSFSI